MTNPVRNKLPDMLGQIGRIPRPIRRVPMHVVSMPLLLDWCFGEPEFIFRPIYPVKLALMDGLSR